MKNFIVTVNGNRYEVQVEETANGSSIQSTAPAPAKVAPTPVVAPIEKPVQKPVAKQESGAAGKIVVESPMPGKIVSVKVTVGKTVAKGDVIATLEAMKMENEIVASQGGVVASVNVTNGQNVESGDIIATLNE